MRTHPAFTRDVTTLKKKYPNVEKDVEDFARLVDADPQQYRGDRMPGFGNHAVYKARVVSRDLHKGKSGGFRAIIEQEEDGYRLMHLYSHSGSSQSGQSETDLRAEVRRRLDT